MDLPVVWANYISIGLFLALGIGVWSIPKSAIVPEEYAGKLGVICDGGLRV